MMVYTPFDFNRIMRILFQIQSRVHAGRAAILSTRNDQTVGQFRAYHHALVRRPLSARTWCGMDGNRFCHVKTKFTWIGGCTV